MKVICSGLTIQLLNVEGMSRKWEEDKDEKIIDI